MKILRLTTFLDFGGIEKRMVNIASVDDNHEWIFCALNKGGIAEKEILAKGKKVYCLNLNYNIPSLLTIYQLYKFLKIQQPDVLHTSGAEANFHGIIAGKLAGVPKIIGEEIGIPQQGFMAKIIFSLIFKLADSVVGNSIPVVTYLRDENKVPSQKLALIPNPILTGSLPEKDLKETDFTIISVSRLDKVKNIKDLIKVTGRLLEEGFKVKLMIVGSGPEELSLKEQVQQMNLTRHISFQGFEPDPYTLLLRSDVFVLNSFKEGFSNALMEAMYSGTPSISTATGAAEELINHGENGWLVEVNNPQDLYEKLKSVIKLSPEERVQIGLKAKTWIEENYALERHIESLLALYD